MVYKLKFHLPSIFYKLYNQVLLKFVLEIGKPQNLLAMKKLLALFFFGIFVSSLSAQTVENIRVEQDGENLKIHYRIGGSTSEQLYFVTLTCTIDGGPEFEPKTVIGDVGGNIRGGKSFNTIIWDVYEDVEDIGKAEFFVQVDLEKDESTKNIMEEAIKELRPEQKTETVDDPGNNYTDYSTPPRKIYVGYAGSVIHPLGFRAATLGNWGGYVHFRYGGWDPNWAQYWAAAEAGVTKRIVNREKFRLHAYLGLGAGDYLDEVEVDYGFLGVFSNRFTLGLGGTTNPWYADVNLGIGVVF